jgi:hypothetical protein
VPPLLTSIGAFKQSATGSAFASDQLAACTGDALTILNFENQTRAYIEEIVSENSAHKCEFAIFAPNFGDPILGFRYQHMFNPTLSGADGAPQFALAPNIDLPVYRSDMLTIQSLCTASDNLNVVLQVYYEDAPTPKQRIVSWEQISGNIRQYLAVEVTVTPGTTGNYGTAVALNANDDRLVGERDYALVGYSMDQPVLSIGIKGPDTGNYRIAMPGNWDQRRSAGYFQDQDFRRPTPHIPVINALSRTQTFLDGLSASNAGATKVSLHFAELRSRLAS